MNQRPTQFTRFHVMSALALAALGVYLVVLFNIQVVHHEDYLALQIPDGLPHRPLRHPHLLGPIGFNDAVSRFQLSGKNRVPNGRPDLFPKDLSMGRLHFSCHALSPLPLPANGDFLIIIRCRALDVKHSRLFPRSSQDCIRFFS